jgi:A/G-specific adenine glycosylase
MKELNEHNVRLIQNPMLDWYTTNGRKLPWRESRDPYAVLIIEKLLQQTSLKEDIIVIYKMLLNKYPNSSVLAIADINDVKIIIQPLGLHYRAQELILIAKQIEEKFNSKIPNDLHNLLSIKGIGDYTARAILCFAYELDVPIVDTNIARILYRILSLPGKVSQNPAREKRLIWIMELLLPKGKSQSFNWGMIDLGALVCKKIPRCTNCPLVQICEFYTNT